MKNLCVLQIKMKNICILLMNRKKMKNLCVLLTHAARITRPLHSPAKEQAHNEQRHSIQINTTVQKSKHRKYSHIRRHTRRI